MECDSDKMKENKIKIIIFLVIMAFVIGCTSLYLFFKKDKENVNDIHETLTNDYIIDEVTNFSEYQSIYLNLLNYYNMLNEDKYLELLDLLERDYINNNNITSLNINNFVEEKMINYTYEITQISKYTNMYYSIYYVEGSYGLEGLEEILNKTLVKHLVIIDIINNTYAIIPLLNNVENFEDAISKYNLINYDKEIKYNNSNEIIQSSVSDFNEASFYFSDYLNKLTNNCNDAYNLLISETKEKYDHSFEEVCTSFKEFYVAPIIKDFKIEHESGKKSITIYDNYNNKYKFYITSIFNYTVGIYLK